MLNLTNPYIVGSPIRGSEMFFGHEDIFEFISQMLNYRNNGILLYGQSRMGKTSVLHQIKSQSFLGENYLRIFIDLHKLTFRDLSDFLWKLANHISQELRKSYNIDLEELGRTAFHLDPRRAFEDRFLNPLWSAIGSKHLLLMLDEAGQLQQQELAEGISYMRYLMQNCERLTFLFSLVEHPQKMQKEYTSLFNSMLLKKVSFLNQAATSDLITKPVKDCYKVEPAALDQIFHITSGHPYHVQLLCSLLFNRWQKHQKSYIGLQDLEEVIGESVEAGSMVHQSLWDCSDMAEQAVMAGMTAAMSSTNHPIKVGEINQAWAYCSVVIPKSDMTNAIQSLIGRDIISGKDEYKFTVDLQQMWIKENKRLEWVEEEIKPAIQQWMALIPTARVSVLATTYPAIPPKKLVHRVGPFGSRRRVVMSLALLVAGGLSIASLELLYNRYPSNFWPVPTPTPTPIPKLLPLGNTFYTYRNHSDIVLDAEWSYDGKYIASSSEDATVQVWDAMSGKNPFIYQGDTASVSTAGWSSDNKRIASGSNDQTIQIWDAMSGKNALMCKGHIGVVTMVGWSPDNKRIVSSSTDWTVREWNSSSGQSNYIYKDQVAPVNAVAWSPDGKYIASGGANGQIVVWDTFSKAIFREYQAHLQLVAALAWSPDSRYIVTGGDDGSDDAIVKVWDNIIGNVHSYYKGHLGNIKAVAWSLNGRYIASGGHDTTVRIWSFSEGREIFTYKEHSNWITTVAWSPNSKYIASGGNDQTVRVWKASI